MLKRVRRALDALAGNKGEMVVTAVVTHADGTTEEAVVTRQKIKWEPGTGGPPLEPVQTQGD